MTPSLLLNNLLLWSLQILLLVAVATLLPALFAMKLPKIRLAFWQLVLLVCLALPAVRPWKQDIGGGAVTVSTAIVAVAKAPASGIVFPFTLAASLLIVAAAGALIRFGFLLSGLVRLGRYRRESRPLTPASPWSSEADLRLSEAVTGPVTFGFRKPVVLLPSGFLQLDDAMRDAILCHEILHVRRHDWLFTAAEEIVRALFWFHPAVWWLLREIQLVREQAVDREVVEITRSRDPYIDALLVIAGAPQSDLAPAPLFLRKRHLKQRVASILKEVRMSTAKSVSAFAASLALIAASGWFVTGAFPLHAAPQLPIDQRGVSVDTGGAGLLHRDPVTYPREAIAKGIQGTVVANVKLDPAGNVTDATIVSGPEELRKAVLQSLLNWHFSRDAAAVGTREVSIAFTLPAPGALIGVNAVGGPAPALGGAIRSIRIVGLSDPARDQLMAQLPVSVGETLTADNFARLSEAVRAFDSHLQAGSARVSASETDIIVSTDRVVPRGLTANPGVPLPPPPPPPPPASPDAIRIGGNVQATKLVNQPKPVYPPLAKADHVQGTVSFQATIGKDGKIQNLQLLSGPPLLAQSAMDAVQQWVYEPTLLNGSPVTVITTIDVNYTLAE